jgi:aminoglycoside phosphotransferase (APT) family kinase protein
VPLASAVRQHEQIAHRVEPGGELRRVSRLEGGISADIVLLEVARDGQVRKLVVRHHGHANLAANPRAAATEFALLQALRGTGIDVPEPCCIDETGEIYEQPFVVVEYIDGSTDVGAAELSRCANVLAEALCAVHRTDLASLPRLPTATDVMGRHLAVGSADDPASVEVGRIRAALQRAWPPAGINGRVLLHGDFWPGNVLWRDGRLVGIIDWEDAALGDPLADLGNTRLELLWAAGADAMRAFTRRYLELNTLDVSALPLWDLAAALKLAAFPTWVEGSRVATMQDQFSGFVDNALNGGRSVL